jgi:hypothetical protein
MAVENVLRLSLNSLGRKIVIKALKQVAVFWGVLHNFLVL